MQSPLSSLKVVSDLQESAPITLLWHNAVLYIADLISGCVLSSLNAQILHGQFEYHRHHFQLSILPFQPLGHAFLRHPILPQSPLHLWQPITMVGLLAPFQFAYALQSHNQINRVDRHRRLWHCHVPPTIGEHRQPRAVLDWQTSCHRQ